MALSLLEASKLIQDERTRATVQIYADAYHPMRVMPMQTRASGIMSWTQEGELDSNVGARSINSDFTAGEGSAEVWKAQTKAYGGKIQVDDKIVTEMPDAVQFQKEMQIKAMARKFTVDFFQGGENSNAELRGLRTWIRSDYTSQNVEAGSTSGGDLPTGIKMLETISKTNIIPGRTFIYSGMNPYLYMTKLSWADDSDSKQAIRFTQDQFGNMMTTFAGIPWIVMQDGKGRDLIATDETQTGISGGTATSIYVVTYGEEMVTGFYSKLPTVKTPDDATNFVTSRLDAYLGVAPLQPRSVARLANVKNATA